MKKIIIKTIKASFIGLGIGYFLSILFSLAYAQGYFSPGVPSYLAQFKQEIDGVLMSAILYAFLGIVFTFSSLIYETKLPLFIKTLVHLSITLLITLSVGSFLHWYSLSLFSILIFLLIFIVVYIIIWTLIYWNKKKKFAQLNQKIQETNHLSTK